MPVVDIHDIKKLNGHWWLVTGALMYFGIAVSCIIGTADPNIGIALNLATGLAWLAASVVYFFFGALIGFVIDRYVLRQSEKRHHTPTWVWFTVFLWIGSVITGFFYAYPEKSPIVLLFFPLAYGVFFTSFAFEGLAPSLAQSVAGSSVLNGLYVATFALWTLLQAQDVKRWHHITRNAFLVILFVILFFGMVSCAQQLT